MKKNTRKDKRALLEEAEFRYKVLEFDTALKLIVKYARACKEVGQSPDLKILELIPLIYIAKNDMERAEFWLGILLYKRPKFKAIAGKYPPDFIKLLEQKRKKIQKSSNNGRVN